MSLQREWKQNDLNEMGIYRVGEDFYQRGRKIKSYPCIRRHKYGKDCVYLNCYVKRTDGKWRLMPLSNLIWLWFKGDIPKGYDIDHIDGDTFNNDLSNLRCISRAENLRAKEWQHNQFNCKREELDLTELKKMLKKN